MSECFSPDVHLLLTTGPSCHYETLCGCFVTPRSFLPLTNPPVQMNQCVCACFCVFLILLVLCMLTGRGGGAEQKEHEDQTDAKADPTQRGGDNQTHIYRRLHHCQHVLCPN